MMINKLFKPLLLTVLTLFSSFGLHAETQPKFTLTALSPTQLVLPANGTATVTYQVSNQTKITRTLTMRAMQGISQQTAGNGFCSNPFKLASKQSCLLVLQIQASQLPGHIHHGPEICKTTSPTDNSPDPFLCSQPSAAASLNIIVKKAVELRSITVTPTQQNLLVGQTQQYTAVGHYSDGSSKIITTTVTWVSSAPTIATISNSGLATGIAPESVSITAVLNGITGSANLIVAAAVLQSITVTPANATIIDGFTQQYTAVGHYSNGSSQDITSLVTWASSDPAIATISNSGLATGVAPGSSTITATLSGIIGSANLTVTAAVLQSISVTPTNPSIAKGTNQQFTATGIYSDSTTQDLTTTVSWSSGTTTVATISNTVGTQGLATAVDIGSSTITATLGGISGSTTLYP